MRFKKMLAKEIVSLYHSESEAKKAEESFVNTFQKGEIPKEMTELSTNNVQNLMDILVQTKNISSKSEFRRLIKEGAVTSLESGEKIDDPNFVPKNGQSFRIGKKTFIKII